MESEVKAAKGLLNTLFLLSTNEAAMELSAKLMSDMERRGNQIGLRDLFIASICIIHSLKLLTRNRKHFEKVKDLKLI